MNMKKKLEKLKKEEWNLIEEITYLKVRLREDEFEFELGFAARLELRIEELRLVTLEIAYIEKKLEK